MDTPTYVIGWLSMKQSLTISNSLCAPDVGQVILWMDQIAPFGMSETGINQLSTGPGLCPSTVNTALVGCSVD